MSHKDEKIDGITILEASESDAEHLAAIIHAVAGDMADSSWFVPDDADDIRKLMNPASGKVWKAEADDTGEIAGLFLLYFPKDAEDNLGYDIGLPEGECRKVAHAESVAVLPKYRGRYLQYRFMRLAEDWARKEQYGYLMCTVHPDNFASRRNIIRCGFQSMKITEKYGGLLREIMMKSIL